MANASLGYEIQESQAPDGGVKLELVLEGTPFVHASVSPTVLAELETTLGIQRAAVISDLRKALLEALRAQGQFVDISEPLEDPDKKLRFVSRFMYQLRDEISTGVVWYDVTESATGPESAPAVVRNKMRHEVHRKLTEPGSSARALVDLHQ